MTFDNVDISKIRDVPESHTFVQFAQVRRLSKKSLGRVARPKLKRAKLKGVNLTMEEILMGFDDFEMEEIYIYRISF